MLFSVDASRRPTPPSAVTPRAVPRVHCLTDVPGTPEAECLDLLAAVTRAGVDAVQVRAKQLTDRALLAFTRAVADRVRPHGAVVLVNDRLDVALAAGADGVHLGGDDLPVAEVRRLAPPGFLVGGTCRSAADAARARDEGADYVGLGPLYATSTKSGLPAPLGLRPLREASRLLPCVAIGGITPDRAGEVMTAGAHGVAVVSALSRAPDPVSAAERIVAAVLR